LSGGTITVIETGVFQVAWTQAQMHVLCGKTYDVDIDLTRAGEVTPLFALSWPVIDRISG
jgi:hypothetical protein